MEAAEHERQASNAATDAAEQDQAGPDRREPPLGGGWHRQRQEAARNRDSIAQVAAALFRERGVDAVEVRDIARAAQVGVGTVYRRFGDKGSLIAAVIGERERELQDSLLRGRPPLGPGAPPRDRLVAFLCALNALTDAHLDLLAASEGSSPGARFRIGSYRAWRLHVAILVAELRPDVDADWFADMLLGPLGADLYRHQRRELDMSAGRIAENLVAAVDLLAQAPAARPRKEQ